MSDVDINALFSGYGMALRRENDPPIPGEPLMSIAAAKEIVRPHFARLKMLEAVATVMDAARANERVLRESLSEMVYATTYLSVMDPTGAHDCTISGNTLAKARAALAQSYREPKP